MCVADRTPPSSDLRLRASYPTLSVPARDIAQTPMTDNQAWVMLIAVISDHCVTGVNTVSIGGCGGSSGRFHDDVYAIASAALVLSCDTAAAWDLSRCS